MKKVVLSLLFGCSLMLNAQQQTLDTVVVSAARYNTSLQSSNRNVVILKAEEIKNAPVQNVAELLDFAIGIDARQRGIFGTQTDLSIRGGTYEQVLVLVNGVRLSDPQTGHHLMNLPVPASEIERIEILLGGGTYIFGGSAFSGAINIITRSATADHTLLDFRYGSFNSYQAGITQTLKGKNHQSSIALNTSSSDGFQYNTDFTQNNVHAQTTVNTGKHSLNINGGFTSQDFGAQNFYSTAFPEQFEKTRTIFANVGLKTEGKLSIDRQLYWRRNYDEFQLYREGENFYEYENGFFIKGNDTAASWYGGHNYHRSDVAGGKLQLQYESKLGVSSLSGEYRLEKIVSNNLGEALQAPISIKGKRGEYTLGSARENISLAAEQGKSIGRFDLSAALLMNYNSSYSTDFYPAFTAGFRLNQRNKFYSSYNKSFRLPSYTDLYYRLGGAVGSKDLKPESSHNFELGYKFISKKVFFNASIFRREGRDIIDWIQYCDTCELMASNTSSVNFNGLDMSLRLKDFDIQKFLKMDFIELGYSFLTTDDQAVDYESLYVFDYLQNKISLRAAHSLTTRLTWTYSLSYQDRKGEYSSPEGLKPYDDVLLINSRLSYSFKKFKLFVEGQNLLNKTYFDRGNVQLPGAWIWTGIQCTL